MATSEDTPTCGMVQSINASVESIKASVWGHLQNIWDHLPDIGQAQVMLSGLVVGLAVAMVGGAILTWVAAFLALLTPVIFFLSPILVAVGCILFIVTAALLGSAGVGFAYVTAAVWLYKYLNGEEPVYSGQIDAARSRIAGTARNVDEWAQSHVPGYSAPQSS